MITDTYISLTKGNQDKEYISNTLDSLISLGYNSAFFVTEIEDREIEETDKCDRSHLVHCLSKLQQTILSKDDTITHSNEFVPYTRLSFSASKRSIFNSFKSPISKGYDVISCRPQNQDIFEQSCKATFVDIIEIPVDDALPFKVTREAVDNAIRNGIFFEFTYATSLRDRSSRRYLLSSCHNIVTFGRGNHILLGSDPQHPMEIRSPNDLITIATLMDIPYEKATAVVYKNPHLVLLHAQKRKLQGGIAIEWNVC